MKRTIKAIGYVISSMLIAGGLFFVAVNGVVLYYINNGYQATNSIGQTYTNMLGYGILILVGIVLIDLIKHGKVVKHEKLYK